MNRLVAMLPALCGLVLFTSCAGSKTEIYRDANGVLWQKHAPLYPINVHGDDQTIMTTAGKTYKDISGLPPCYSEIPELHSILFVTAKGPSDDDATFHVLNVETKKEISFHQKGAVFGGHIGTGRKAGEAYTDYIEKVLPPDKLIIATKYPNLKTSYSLNLSSKKIERIDQSHYDNNGSLMGHDVYATPSGSK